MRTGWQWVADVAAARGPLVGWLLTRRLWGWVLHHPWDAHLMLRVMDTARDPRVSATVARLIEDTWTRGAMHGDLHQALASTAVPYPPRPRTHLARRVVHAHLSGDLAERDRLDPDGRILDRCLGRDRDARHGWHLPPEPRWTVDAERERLLAARRRVPPLGGGPAGPGPSGGGGRGISGSAYGGSF